MKHKPIIRETVVGQIEKDNLYYENLYGFLGVGDDDDIPDYDWFDDYDQHKHYWKDGEHIPIEMLQAVVDELKAKGATHVQIYSHGDHQSYYFTGVKLELMDEKEAQKRQKQVLKSTIEATEQVLQFEEDELKEKRKHLEEDRERLKGWE